MANAEKVHILKYNNRNTMEHQDKQNRPVLYVQTVWYSAQLQRPVLKNYCK